jgi:hypothetical protein
MNYYFLALACAMLACPQRTYTKDSEMSTIKIEYQPVKKGKIPDRDNYLLDATVRIESLDATSKPTKRLWLMKDRQPTATITVPTDHILSFQGIRWTSKNDPTYSSEKGREVRSARTTLPVKTIVDTYGSSLRIKFSDNQKEIAIERK